MNPPRMSEQFGTLFGLAVQLARVMEADAVLAYVAGPVDWKHLQKLAGKQPLIVAADSYDHVEGAAEFGIDILVPDSEAASVYEKMSQVLLKGVAEEILAPGGSVIAVYNGFEPGKVDSVSFVRLDDHLGRLTVRDLRQLSTRVPLDTLKTVIDLAVDIGREGREGKPVGTMFVVGDTRNVLAKTQPTGFDPVKGYGRKERSLRDSRVREGIREVAQLDGAFLVSADGTVEAACRLIDAPAENITLSKGLGTRHWAAAAITKSTSAVAVVVSESGGTVRIFQNGEVVLRVEPFRRAMKWKDFDYERPTLGGE